MGLSCSLCSTLFLGFSGANLGQYAFGVLLPGWWQAIQSYMMFV